MRPGHTYRTRSGVSSAIATATGPHLVEDRNAAQIVPGKNHDSKNCSRTFRCVNFEGEHPAYSRRCPSWQYEKEIVRVKVQQKLSYRDARKTVSPPSFQKSFSEALRRKVQTASVCTQTLPVAQLPPLSSCRKPTRAIDKVANKVGGCPTAPETELVSAQTRLPPKKGGKSGTAQETVPSAGQA